MFKDNNKQFGTGAIKAPEDKRDLIYEDVVMGATPFDWEKGFDIRKELNIEIPFKDQNSSSSCVGQAWSYYGAMLDTKEVGSYNEQSAKALYSQIFLPSGGAYIKSGANLFVDWGSLPEKILTSYENGNPPSEAFVRDLSWKNAEMDWLAQNLQSKEYRKINAATNIDLFAMAIRDNLGVVSGVNGDNNGTWGTLEPKPPTTPVWGHALYFGVAGMDDKGKYIATPNSWGNRFNRQWQKLREDYFTSGNMFDAWTLIDKPNKDMIKFRLIQQIGEKAVWFVGADGVRRFFFDEDQYKSIAPILGLPTDFSGLEALSKDAINQIPAGKPIVAIK